MSKRDLEKLGGTNSENATRDRSTCENQIQLPLNEVLSNLNVIRRHFNTLEAVLIENDIFDKPDKLFNVDESGLNLQLRKGKVVLGAKQTHSYSKVESWDVTVNCCISAVGDVVLPFIIYKECTPSGNYEEKGPFGALYGESPNGYMDGRLLSFGLKSSSYQIQHNLVVLY